jgi:hypothetical protein
MVAATSRSYLLEMWTNRVAFTLPLHEELILNLDEFDRRGASFVVLRHAVDPRAHGIAPHEPGVAGLQQLGRRSYIIHPRIEPQVVAVRLKDDRHAVVDGRGYRVRRRGQNRAGLQRVAARVPPAIPNSREGEQLPSLTSKQYGCFALPLLPVDIEPRTPDLPSFQFRPAMPARTRSRIRSDSSSAMELIKVRKSRPMGPLVSMFSRREMNSIPDPARRRQALAVDTFNTIRRLLANLFC